MATLTELNFYPIKSCAAIALREATLTPAGLMHDLICDREWMVVDMQGNFMTQREYPALARIVPRICAEHLKLRAPGMPELQIALDLPDAAQVPALQVRVWDDTLMAYDCDATTARWFSQAVGVQCRLVRFDPSASRVTNTRWTAHADVPALFSDGYPFLLISQASLADLNQKLAAQGRAPLPMNRFRPNLVIDGVAAFEEDYIESLRIGAATLKPVKPCARCPIPSVDQATGIVGPDPLDILRSYRANPKLDGGITFGMNAILESGATQVVRVGQEIDITLAF
ncbi:MOSC domain-containing protein [Herminiimonas sp. CN]|uniref:MOSC domain-containing protein n=1 Tax=Herminiimonas sp. CN TaxID=1349818 RepID=UPI0004740EA6|nr:MOSC N-terminal beta barrel domain-containing protein [Herminiimonas sp. CN]